ncbi:response regulator transcription factor [Rhodocyclus purpureus]|uniref:response regulator transcription factor n=1 Tax=Rhodocyclus purpureus TaxID=1067 RepID=UPI0019124851|nr:response regulator transcription factor [Rhodocyclus purpureus]MBK5913067.1 hypothetical protein [Rhodocyclus purpureus]
MKIIVVEDNLDLQQEFLFLLHKNGHEAVGASSAAELDARIAEDRPDVILLDVGLPGEDGFSIARRLSGTPGLGIVMLTARGSDEDQVLGIEGGADNYLVKPVNNRVLLAVLDRVYRRLHAPPSSGKSVWQLRRQERVLLSPAGKEVVLTETEQELIATMVRCRGKAASRRQLIEALGHDFLLYDERRIEVKISRLRKKIRDAADGEDPLKSEWGVGYAFAAPCLLV